MLHQRMHSFSWTDTASVLRNRVDELFLEVAEEVLHHGVVVAVALAEHRLNRTGILQKDAPGDVLVLETLVRMQERLLSVLERCQGAAQ